MCCSIAGTQGYFIYYIASKQPIKTRYTLGKEERIKSRKLLEHLFRQGSNFFVHPFKVYYSFSPLQQDSLLQAAFGVSSRVFKKAVDRNRIKRLMREAYRLQKAGLQSTMEPSGKKLAVFFLYTGKELPEFAGVREKMSVVLKRLESLPQRASM